MSTHRRPTPGRLLRETLEHTLSAIKRSSKITLKMGVQRPGAYSIVRPDDEEEATPESEGET